MTKMILSLYVSRHVDVMMYNTIFNDNKNIILCPIASSKDLDNNVCNIQVMYSLRS